MEGLAHGEPTRGKVSIGAMLRFTFFPNASRQVIEIRVDKLSAIAQLSKINPNLVRLGTVNSEAMQAPSDAEDAVERRSTDTVNGEAASLSHQSSVSKSRLDRDWMFRGWSCAERGRRPKRFW